MTVIDRIAALAAQGLSTAQAAKRLGLTRNAVAGRARDNGIKFHGPQFVGGGCDSDAALRGWETRRSRGWASNRVVGMVRHVG